MEVTQQVKEGKTSISKQEFVDTNDMTAMRQEESIFNSPEEAQQEQIIRKQSSKKVRKGIKNVFEKSDGHEENPTSTLSITKHKVSEPASVTKEAIPPVPLAFEVPEDHGFQEGGEKGLMDSSMSSIPPSDFDFLKKKKIIKTSIARGRPKEYTIMKAKEVALIKANQATRFERQEELVEKIRQHAAKQKKKQEEKEGDGKRDKTTDSLQDTTQKVQIVVSFKRKPHGLRGSKPQNPVICGRDRSEEEGNKKDQQEGSSESDNEDEEAFQQMLLLPTSNTSSNSTNTQKNVKPMPPPPSKDPDLTFSQTLKAKTSDQIACEMKLHQEIIVREQQVRRLHELIKILEEISHHFYEFQLRLQATFKSISDPHNTRGRRKSSFLQAQSVAPVQQPTDTSTTTTLGTSVPPSKRTSLTSVDASTAALTCTLILEQQEEAKMKKKQEELITRTKYRIQELLQVIWCLQETSMSIVELLELWRELRIKWDLENNRSDQGLHRFLWQGKVNYLLKMDQDLKDLFPSLGLMLAIGTNIFKAKTDATASQSSRGNSNKFSISNTNTLGQKQSQQSQQPPPPEEMTHEALANISASLKLVYNPLLLTAEILSQLGLDSSLSSSIKTFMTETMGSDRQTKNKTSDETTVKHLNHAQVPLYFVMQQVLLQKLGYQSISPCFFRPSSRQRLERLSYCHEIIVREHLLEEQDLQRQREEEEAIAQAYDPFSKVQSIAQLDETFNQVLHESYLKDNSGTSVPLATQLRQRQQEIDKNCGSTLPIGGSIRTSGRSVATCGPLVHVNTKRMRQLMEQKKDICIQVSTTLNGKYKLPGSQLMYRQINRKNILHEKARKIQLQYQVHRHRMHILSHLSNFTTNVRANSVNIQRIYRGYRGRIHVNTIRLQQLQRLEELQSLKLRSAITIQRFSRRYMRLQRATGRHFALAVEFFEDSASANASRSITERYRLMGEARRKQREYYLQQKKQEQMELEEKKNAAAVSIQNSYRGYQARKYLYHLVEEKMAHAKAISAIRLQSNIRKFLGIKNAKRMKFHQDLERVNCSVVKIQSIYRGFTSRNHVIEKTLNQEERDKEEEFTYEEIYQHVLPSLAREQQENFHSVAYMLETKAPSPVRAAGRVMSTLPPVQLPSLAVIPLKKQQRLPSYSRMELKLKQPSLGDDF